MRYSEGPTDPPAYNEYLYCDECDEYNNCVHMGEPEPYDTWKEYING